MTEPISPAIPAATLVIFRDRPSLAPELLMVERAGSMAFAGGALVFPGGRVDPADRTLAQHLIQQPADQTVLEEVAARIAAIRETIEEVGLAIGLHPAPSADTLATLRAALHAGRELGPILDELGLRCDPHMLTYFARWRPAHHLTRIFDTRFYLARLPADAAPARVDETENVRLLWATAAEILAHADAGRAQVIFPTRRNLERLALFAGFDEAIDDARRRPVRTVTPWIEPRDGIDHFCIPDDLGYPVTSEPVTRVAHG